MSLYTDSEITGTPINFYSTASYMSPKQAALPKDDLEIDFILILIILNYIYHNIYKINNN